MFDLPGGIVKKWFWDRRGLMEKSLWEGPARRIKTLGVLFCVADVLLPAVFAEEGGGGLGGRSRHRGRAAVRALSSLASGVLHPPRQSTYSEKLKV